jgi:hypothetical protein
MPEKYTQLTNSMEQSYLRRGYCNQLVHNFSALIETDGSFSLQEPATYPYPEPYAFNLTLIFYTPIYV